MCTHLNAVAVQKCMRSCVLQALHRIQTAALLSPRILDQLIRTVCPRDEEGNSPHKSKMGNSPVWLAWKRAIAKVYTSCPVTAKRRDACIRGMNASCTMAACTNVSLRYYASRRAPYSSQTCPRREMRAVGAAWPSPVAPFSVPSAPLQVPCRPNLFMYCTKGISFD